MFLSLPCSVLFTSPSIPTKTLQKLISPITNFYDITKQMWCEDVLEANTFGAGKRTCWKPTYSKPQPHTQLAAISKKDLCQHDRYTQLLTSKYGWYHAADIRKVYLCTTLFSVRLQVLTKQRSNFQPHTLLASNQQSQSSQLCMCIHIQLLCKKPKKCLNKSSSWRLFWGSSLPVVAHTQLQTRKRSPLPQKSFGMYNFCIHYMVLELCMVKKKEKKKKEEDEHAIWCLSYAWRRRRRRKKMNKTEISRLVFSSLRKVSWTNLATEYM